MSIYTSNTDTQPTLKHVCVCQVDYDEDGVITYREFAPLCYDLLVEVVNLEIQRSQVEAAEEEAIEEARMLEVRGHVGDACCFPSVGVGQSSRHLYCDDDPSMCDTVHSVQFVHPKLLFSPHKHSVPTGRRGDLSGHEQRRDRAVGV